MPPYGYLNHPKRPRVRVPQKPRRCVDCGAEFTPRSGNAKRCDECRERITAARNRAKVRRWRAAKLAAMSAAELTEYRRREVQRQREYRERQKG